MAAEKPQGNEESYTTDVEYDVVFTSVRYCNYFAKRTMLEKMIIDALAIFIAQYLYLIVLLVAAVFFFLQPKTVKKSMVVCGAIIAPVAFILSRISSYFYYDPRPFVVGHFVPLIAHTADNGFPSDHVLLTGAVAMIVWFYDKKWSTFLSILALFIGASRVYVGVHHATDIVGSIVMTIVASLIYWFTVGRRKALKESK